MLREYVLRTYDPASHEAQEDRRRLHLVSMERSTTKRKRIETRLNTSELKDFKKARKYVYSFCGKVSDAEVLRFLVRNWLEQGIR